MKVFVGCIRSGADLSCLDGVYGLNKADALVIANGVPGTYLAPVDNQTLKICVEQALAQRGISNLSVLIMSHARFNDPGFEDKVRNLLGNEFETSRYDSCELVYLNEVQFKHFNADSYAGEVRPLRFSPGRWISESPEAFLDGMAYATSVRYDDVQMTVDVVIYNEAKHELIMGYRNGRIRFVGGFVDLADDSKEDAALREMAEETGVKNPSEVMYVCSSAINDGRYPRVKGSKTGVMTTMFLVKVQDANPEANDDIEAVCSVKISDFLDAQQTDFLYIDNVILKRRGTGPLAERIESNARSKVAEEHRKLCRKLYHFLRQNAASFGGHAEFMKYPTSMKIHASTDAEDFSEQGTEFSGK